MDLQLQMEMEERWMEATDAGDAERRPREEEWRAAMVALGEERLALVRRWREREDAWRARAEEREERRHQLVAGCSPSSVGARVRPSSISGDVPDADAGHRGLGRTRRTSGGPPGGPAGEMASDDDRSVAADSWSIKSDYGSSTTPTPPRSSSPPVDYHERSHADDW